jgi:hypothetical protein
MDGTGIENAGREIETEKAGKEVSLDVLFEQMTQAIKNILIQAITMCLTHMFSDVNHQTASLAGEIGKTPQQWNGSIFGLLQTIHSSIAVPIAGIVITFVLCYELITMVTEKNNMADVDSWMVFRWIFKAVIAIMLVSHAWEITMAFFDLGQWVVTKTSAVITGNTAINIDSMIAGMDLSGYNIGELLLLLLESFIFQALMFVITVGVTIVVYIRMIEIYMYASIAAVPMATLTNREWGQMGTNYLKGIMALAFQGFFMMLCVGIYDTLVAVMPAASNVFAYFPQIAIYTFMLLIVLFKTGSISKGIFDAH